MKTFILLALMNLFHGGDIATFTITTTNAKVYVAVKLEAAAIAEALDVKIDAIDKGHLQHYLNTHITYTINGQNAGFEITDMEATHNHLVVHTTLEGTYSLLKHLKIKNTTLFEVKSRQTNVVRLRYNTTSRDFLINQKRSTITINL